MKKLLLLAALVASLHASGQIELSAGAGMVGNSNNLGADYQGYSKGSALGLYYAGGISYTYKGWQAGAEYAVMPVSERLHNFVRIMPEDLYKAKFGTLPPGPGGRFYNTNYIAKPLISYSLLVNRVHDFSKLALVYGVRLGYTSSSGKEELISKNEYYAGGSRSGPICGIQTALKFKVTKHILPYVQVKGSYLRLNATERFLMYSLSAGVTYRL